MPQARPSDDGPRSTRKVQPVQSSRASFLWLFSSVAMVAHLWSFLGLRDGLFVGLAMDFVSRRVRVVDGVCSPILLSSNA